MKLYMIPHSKLYNFFIKLVAMINFGSEYGVDWKLGRCKSSLFRVCGYYVIGYLQFYIRSCEKSSNYNLPVFAFSIPVQSQYQILIMKTSCYLMKLYMGPHIKLYQLSIKLVVMINFGLEYGMVQLWA